ncbi:imidazole glycerol phosphate synthase subunit HisH [Corallincola holothuriorum]|uniref:Imidazole glycerol phosphate synthase subunit HisH n=1 Tax=Corallincola holothuriorum TaxID=2282215 RepID=A0A368NIU6_9GAMM|nr:imidazole glycerol phosphate synthase subunit HisH [Corallincola holothuriorum]RCU50368.1 imidazole glycerol phosphate synthase subunit HisH [Corallincola holothuriorum]
MTTVNTAQKVVIIDTGCANIASVKFAVQRLGYAVEVSADHDTIKNADKVFLPGVGSASEAMKNIQQRDLVALVQQLTQPVLGICLGMQLMASHSAEGDVACLDLVPTEVAALEGGNGLRLPHMGWNAITPNKGHPLFKDIPNGTYFYFVHSFAVPVGDYTAASSEYGQPFSASISRNNFFGVQFHPERSAKAGAQLIKNFLEM